MNKATDQKIFFAAGLPRSGSTLALNLLNQHPQLVSTATSPLPSIIGPILNGWRNVDAFQSLHSDWEAATIVTNIVSGVLTNAYNHLPKEKSIIIKNRAWPDFGEALLNALGYLKIIAFVRDIPSILSSMERIRIRTRTVLINTNEPSTMPPRLENLMSSEGLVGSAYNTLLSAYQRDMSEYLLMVEYDYLLANPQHQLARIEDFLEVERHQYKLKEFEQTIFERDLLANGYLGLHMINTDSVSPKAKALPEEVIGPTMCAMYGEKYPTFWR